MDRYLEICTNILRNIGSSLLLGEAVGAPSDSLRELEELAERLRESNPASPAHFAALAGDARVQMERELASGQVEDFDVIAVDAFSSDAIPLHLLTAECGDIYRRRLSPGGFLLLHISNRSLNLEPVTRGLAQHLGWQAAELVSTDHIATGESSSNWVLITANTDFLKRPEITGTTVHWAGKQRPSITWTDDFASLWHVLKL